MIKSSASHNVWQGNQDPICETITKEHLKIKITVLYQLKPQHSNLIVPLSAPRSMRRFRGKTAIVVSTPLKVSDLSLVEEKEAVGEMEVWTPILLAVVPVMTSSPYRLNRCTGSVGPLQDQLIK